ncbi:MAG: hypothetical protein ACXADA_04095 [Candidatus Hodarchaeales archaeon]|jgi:sporulation protein YlmC with PRC-barrel domain
MKFGQSSCFSQIKKKKVIDKDGKEIGKSLIDVILSPEFEVSHYIVGGGRIEEFLEDIKLKKDVDPVFSADSIDEIFKDIKLSVTQSELKSAHEGGVPEGHHRLSELSKMKVVDNKGEEIGNTIDVAFFDGHYSMSFVIGGSSIEEWLEKINVIPDIDLVLPSQNVTSIKDNKINISLSRVELKTTLVSDLNKGSELKKVGFQDVRKKVALVHRQTLLS